MNVAATCRALKVSRKTFYKYVCRFEVVGVAGFYPDSRRPRSSPARLPAELEDVLVMLRKQETDAGWDSGADAILMRLDERRDQLWPPERKLPSRTTINRVLEGRGLLAKAPQRRPRRRYRRFERSHVNALWQYDGFPTGLPIIGPWWCCTCPTTAPGRSGPASGTQRERRGRVGHFLPGRVTLRAARPGAHR